VPFIVVMASMAKHGIYEPQHREDAIHRHDGIYGKTWHLW
jgi:hypothetical protein